MNVAKSIFFAVLGIGWKIQLILYLQYTMRKITPFICEQNITTGKSCEWNGASEICLYKKYCMASYIYNMWTKGEFCDKLISQRKDFDE